VVDEHRVPSVDSIPEELGEVVPLPPGAYGAVAVLSAEVHAARVVSPFSVFKKPVQPWLMPEGIRGLLVELVEGAGVPWKNERLDTTTGVFALRTYRRRLSKSCSCE
jgi:hypothetical protein